ncbi:hypothetical protein JYT87_00685 [Nitrospira defluvii]|nr:hypothetical protein [Nitrospira defluvii]
MRHNAIQKCLAFGENCPSSVIQAHSIQGSFIIDRLAQDGHVYMFSLDYSGGGLSLVGRNRASTFTGFCQNHDSTLFREVDFDGKRNFNLDSKRQICLLSLRAVAREYWLKLNTYKMTHHLMKIAAERDLEAARTLLNFPSLDEKLLMNGKNYYKWFLTGTKESTARLERIYSSLSVQLQRNRFHLMRCHVFNLKGEPTLAVASGFAPEFDLQGRHINSMNLENDPTDVVLNIFPSDSGTIVLFSYHRRHDPVLEPFFNQIKNLDENELKKLISKIVVMHCENLILAPQFVDTLPPNKRGTLERFYYETISEPIPYDQVPSDVTLFN